MTPINISYGDMIRIRRSPAMPIIRVAVTGIDVRVDDNSLRVTVWLCGDSDLESAEFGIYQVRRMMEMARVQP